MSASDLPGEDGSQAPLRSDAELSDRAGPSTPESELAADAGWSRLLDYLLNTRGFDFRGYKAPGLARRVRKRMAEARVDGFAEYQDFLEVHPEEFATLFDTILINVTTFFRDPEAWEVIRNTILPRVVATKSVGEPIRIWSAGCASGRGGVYAGDGARRDAG